MGLIWILICAGACSDAVAWSRGRDMSRETWDSASDEYRGWVRSALDGDGCGYGDGYGYGDGSGYGYGSGYGHGDGHGDGYGDGYGDGHGDGYGDGYGGVHNDIEWIRHAGIELTGDVSAGALALIESALSANGVA